MLNALQGALLNIGERWMQLGIARRIRPVIIKVIAKQDIFLKLRN